MDRHGMEAGRQAGRQAHEAMSMSMSDVSMSVSMHGRGQGMKRMQGMQGMQTVLGAPLSALCSVPDRDTVTQSMWHDGIMA
jgi:hypothetical protein